ncbi:NB-ARC domain-containing protein [Streptomyces sp. NPDC005492]|uniref:NB-ARC domain-containing protein n=1 Tax=Streptomyces sp. NPDC005492 TaxID=3156883 RepID=UPI0033B0328C
MSDRPVRGWMDEGDCVEAELAALAVSGATTLVGLMVSESWERAKAGVARVLGRRASGGSAEEELRLSSEELARARAAGDEGAEEAARARWRQRLETLFREDPGAAEELGRLLADVAPDASRAFVNLVSGGTYYGPVFQGAQIHGGIAYTIQQAPAADCPARPDQVPALTVPFSNRTAELAALDDMFGARGDTFGRVDVGVLDGLPGVGKTTMARRWAETARGRFPDGQLYVDFAALRDQSTMPAATGADVSEALAMCLRSLPGSHSAIPDSLVERTNLFRSRSADLRILLVLDDVNQPAQVRALVPKGPGSAVLVTSRSRLGELAMRNEARLISVKPLDTHGGLALLADRCGAEAVEAERDAAVRLVELCGGLPVALQIVAARLVTEDGLSMAALSAELDDEAGRLAGMSWEGEEYSVSAVLGPAYRLLPADAARLYRRIGWLPFGTFDAGVAAVAADFDTRDVKRLLGVLAKASLVESLGDGRYHMHDLVRLHARECAEQEESATEHAAVIERVGTHYLVLTAFADRALKKNRLRIADLSALLRDAADPFAAVGGPPPLEWLDTEHSAILAVLRTASRHGAHTLVWRLAEAFTALFLYRRYLGAWKESLELGAVAAAAAAAAPSATEREVEEATAAEARLRSLLSRPLLGLGENDRAKRELETAVARSETVDRLDLRASVQEFLGRYRDLFEPSRAAEAYRRSLELNVLAEETRGAAIAALFLGCAQDATGDHAEAMVTLLRARSELLSDDEPDLRMAARATAAIGVVHGHLGETEEALRVLGEAARELREQEAMHYEAEALIARADIAEQAGGRTDLVRECLVRAVEIHEALGNPRAAELRRRLGDLEG